MNISREFRNLLAEELRRGGNEAIAAGVEQFHDNNAVAVAALRAMQRLHTASGVRPARRERVYSVIDGERDYQEEKRTEFGYTQQPDHEIAAYLTFMDNYMGEAKHIITRDWTPRSAARTLDTLRKVVALGVACMEVHGVPIRTTK